MQTATARRRTETLSGWAVIVGERTLPLTIRIDSRAKRLILRLETSGGVRVTCPSRRHVRAALAMAKSRRDWISAQLHDLPSPQSLDAGSTIPILDAPVAVIQAPGERVAAHRDGACIVVTGHDAAGRVAAIVDLLRRELLEFVSHAAVTDARRIGEVPPQVRVRDMKTRWGSCSAARRVTFNWRLIFAPRDIARYVVAHEIAHLQHMNHSPAFWALVAHLCPRYAEHERWLRQRGPSLFTFGHQPPALPSGSPPPTMLL